MPRIIGLHDMEIIQTQINAFYAIHNDTIGHSGEGMFMGRGLMHSKSSNH